MVINTPKIQVIIAMHPSLFRNGIEYVLALHNNFEFTFIHVENNIHSNFENVRNSVAIVDVDMADSDGFKVIRNLKNSSPEIKIIALTGNYNDALLFQVLKAQANACLRKDVSAEELLKTVRDVAEGENPIKANMINSPHLADQVILQFQRLFEEKETQGFMSCLTLREREILAYLARGLMNKQIALELNISEQTIKNHVTSILRKLNVTNRNKAVAVARYQGILTE